MRNRSDKNNNLCAVILIVFFFVVVKIESDILSDKNGQASDIQPLPPDTSLILLLEYLDIGRMNTAKIFCYEDWNLLC